MSSSRKGKRGKNAKGGNPAGDSPKPAAPAAKSPAPSRRQMRIFRLVAIALPFLLLGLVEAGLRLAAGSNEERDPYINISPMSVFSHTVINGQEYFNITHTNILGGENVHILAKKPANTFRVFCLGSSACAGWPHSREETFSAYLQQALQTAYPGKTIEVINAAGHGFAAYRTRRVLDEALKLEPDLLLVWEGNNEFLEDRSYATPLAGLAAVAGKLQTVQWLRKLIHPPTQMSGAGLKDAEKFFFAKSRAQSLRLRADPFQFSQVQAHFQDSFERMVQQSESHHVPLILCTVPVNLRDWLPTASTNRLTGAQFEQWQQLYNSARRDLLTGDAKAGIQAMRSAIALENLNADSWFWLGRLLEADGQRDAAWSAFSQARDLDYNPFRAISGFNDVIKKLAKENEHSGVYLLDLDQIFARAASNSAPGFDLFLDYVHPTKTANLLVAENAYNLVTHAGWLPGQPAVPRFTYHELPFGPKGEPYMEGSDPNLDIVVIEMAGQNRQFQRVVDKSEEMMRLKLGRAPTGPDDPEFSQVPTEFADRYRVLWHYLDVQRRVILGAGVSAQEQADAKRALDALYDQWFPYGKL